MSLLGDPYGLGGTGLTAQASQNIARWNQQREELQAMDNFKKTQYDLGPGRQRERAFFAGKSKLAGALAKLKNAPVIGSDMDYGAREAARAAAIGRLQGEFDAKYGPEAEADFYRNDVYSNL